jgi:hypothetical protein
LSGSETHRLSLHTGLGETMAFTSFKPSYDDVYDGFALCPLLTQEPRPFGCVAPLPRDSAAWTEVKCTANSRPSASTWHAGKDSQYDRTVLLEMALLWSRLAEYATQSAARQEATCPG